jgi:hypothetical protein
MGHAVGQVMHVDPYTLAVTDKVAVVIRVSRRSLAALPTEGAFVAFTFDPVVIAAAIEPSCEPPLGVLRTVPVAIPDNPGKTYSNLYAKGPLNAAPMLGYCPIRNAIRGGPEQRPAIPAPAEPTPDQGWIDRKFAAVVREFQALEKEAVANGMPVDPEPAPSGSWRDKPPLL